MPDPPQLSVVIPAYNEASRLPATLARIAAFLDGAPRWRPAEIIVVDDGSRDGTAAVGEGFGGRDGIAVRVVRLGTNRGKGAAVRAGLEASRGEWVLISDADLAAPIEDIDLLHAAGVDLAVGSRALRRELISRRQPWARDLMGRGFNLMLRGLGLTSFRDTQCGFKLLRGELARSLGRQLRLDGFAFDVEMLARSRRLGSSIREVPVHWAHVDESRVRALRHSLQMARDVLRLRLWLWLGR
ncbi:MAG TPA: glycosyltransferase family 2 protein [Thermoanaerobaculaceae bacterium]|nr:glycosyltransferase family 2 protein [Thermoanaerobaculaceae bacterium]HRS17194.1 glycosyltransferase family 2 protein [Thermoanaerobaculaceae bacterium]